MYSNAYITHLLPDNMLYVRFDFFYGHIYQDDSDEDEEDYELPDEDPEDILKEEQKEEEEEPKYDEETQKLVDGKFIGVTMPQVCN